MFNLNDFERSNFPTETKKNVHTKETFTYQEKKIFKIKRKTDQKNRRYFEKISEQPIVKCGAIL